MSQKFAIVRRGYDPVEVDQYIHDLEAIVSQRNQELSVYREKEAAITNSVVEANRLAEKITKEAEDEAAKKVQEAEEAAAKIQGDAMNRMEGINQKVLAMRDKLEGFKLGYNQLVQQYLMNIKAKDMTALFEDLSGFMKELGLNKDEEPVSVDSLSVHTSGPNGNPQA